MPPNREVMCVISITFLLVACRATAATQDDRILPFSLTRTQPPEHLPPLGRSGHPDAMQNHYIIKYPAATRFILQENHFFHTFCPLCPESKRKFFDNFTLILHSVSDTGHPVSLPAPPLPPAECPPRTKKSRCRCTLPHVHPHNAVQNPSSVSPPVRSFCPGGSIIPQKVSHKGGC